MAVSLELRERIARLPRSPGVYLWKGEVGAVVYVGKAIDLRSRVTSYFDPDRPKTAALMEEASDLDFIAVRTEKEALVLEQTLIKRHRPRYNVRLNDDKSYPYLKLTDEPYPRLLKVFRRDDDKGTYFGPFPDGSGAFFIAQAIQELVPLRRCRVLPKEKCLYLDIGKCAGPCIAACTDAEYDELVGEVRDLLEGKADHLLDRVRERLEAASNSQRFEEAARLRNQLHGLENILDRQFMVQDKLEERDIACLDARGDLAVAVLLHQRDGKVVGQSAFNLAGAAPGREGEALADFLRGYYQDRRVPRFVACGMEEPLAPGLEADLRLLSDAAVTVETPRRGDKTKWLEVAATNARLRLEEELLKRDRRGSGALEALQRHLALAAAPRIIEGFDISHMAGELMRAAMVRFIDGEPEKAGYRTFGMKSVGAAAVAAGTATTKGSGRDVDDFAAIGEAVERRYRGVLERAEPLPDLILIDGGPGQLSAARESLKRLGLSQVPLCSLAKRDEELFVPGRTLPLKLKRSDPGLQLLQRVRDEAHRFGITQVQRKATDSVLESPLDGVPGIGPKRRVELVKTFGGLEGLRTAAIEDLQRVPGVTAAMAAAIQAALAE
ncbi:MAG: excinuclease ABC subunit UvrC [Candidatus Thermoplasmatota archaeon]